MRQIRPGRSLARDGRRGRLETGGVPVWVPAGRGEEFSPLPTCGNGWGGEDSNLRPADYESVSGTRHDQDVEREWPLTCEHASHGYASFRVVRIARRDGDGMPTGAYDAEWERSGPPSPPSVLSSGTGGTVPNIAKLTRRYLVVQQRAGSDERWRNQTLRKPRRGGSGGPHPRLG